MAGNGSGMYKDLFTKKERKAIRNMMSSLWPLSCVIVIVCLFLLALISLMLMASNGVAMQTLLRDGGLETNSDPNDLLDLLRGGARGLVVVGIFGGALFAMILMFAVREYGLIIRKIIKKHPEMIQDDKTSSSAPANGNRV